MHDLFSSPFQVSSALQSSLSGTHTCCVRFQNVLTISFSSAEPAPSLSMNEKNPICRMNPRPCGVFKYAALLSNFFLLSMVVCISTRQYKPGPRGRSIINKDQKYDHRCFIVSDECAAMHTSDTCRASCHVAALLLP